MITIYQMPPQDPIPEEVKLLEQTIENELLDLILLHLENGSLDLEKGQTLAKEYLALLPFHDKAELIKKLGTLSSKYQEAQEVYAKFAGEVEKKDAAERVEQMSQHIKSGNIEEALKVAKGEE